MTAWVRRGLARSAAGRSRSIRRRLVTLLLAAVAGTWLTAAVIAWREARHEIDELLDAHLAQSASLLVAQGAHELEEIEVEHLPELHRYGRRVAFQLWEQGRVLRVHSENAPNERRLSDTENGFSNSVVDGRRWRVFSTWDDRRRWLVQVGEQRRSRDHIASAVARTLAVPLAVALPILGIAVWIAVSQGLRPLTGLSEQLAHRAPDNLAAIDVPAPPAEIRPMVDNLNRLLARVSASIANERRFTADAAHELRTPLAALRAQAQVALGAQADAQRARALRGVVEGCDRAAHLVDQLLTLARLEPEAFAVRLGSCDLRAVAREAVGDLAPVAVRKDVDIELVEGDAVHVQGDPALLLLLSRNLVDNAIRYTAPGTPVRVELAAAADGASLRVADRGDGVSTEDRERLGERFFRAGRTDVAGSGLGLAIVRRIAEIHGARVRFEPGIDGRGLAVRVIFPSPVASRAGAPAFPAGAESC